MKKIFCEDSHGINFFNKLIDRLKRNRIVQPSLIVDADRFAGICNTKTRRQVAAASSAYERVVIVVDAHGQSTQEVENQVKEHIPQELREITCIVVLSHEIEEWLCVGMGIKFSDKPSDKLKYEIRYEKFRLPSFAEKLNISNLKEHASFSRFIECLKS